MIHVHSVLVVVMATSSIQWLESSPECGNVVVAFLNLGSFGIELFHGSGGFDGSTEGKLNCNLGVKVVKELF